MAKIEMHKATEAEIEKLGCRSWPVWTCGVSTFEWEYDQQETCLILQGQVTVTSRDGAQSASFGPGDLVIFPKGLECTWKVAAPVRKHYKFE